MANTEDPINIKQLANDVREVPTTDKRGGAFVFIGMGQGTATKFDEDDPDKDKWFTHPNLYRRIHKNLPKDESEILPRDYILEIQGVNSYTYIHDNTYLDYQEFEDILEDPNLTEEEKAELTRRFTIFEEKEIP